MWLGVAAGDTGPSHWAILATATAHIATTTTSTALTQAEGPEVFFTYYYIIIESLQDHNFVIITFLSCNHKRSLNFTIITLLLHHIYILSYCLSFKFIITYFNQSGG